MHHNSVSSIRDGIRIAGCDIGTEFIQKERGIIMEKVQPLRFTQDYHIHTYLSSCSSDPEQTPARILEYAHENGLEEVCITDHLWDAAVPGASDWYRPQDIAHVRENLPLPADPKVRMHFGCETDMDRNFRLGLSEEHFDIFEFIIVPTTHLHMRGFTISEEDWGDLSKRRALVIERLDRLLDGKYPFRKMGLAHMTCPLAAGYENQWENHIRLFAGIPDHIYEEQFKKAAGLGIGIELNAPINDYQEQELEQILRPYRIAKACGCKFYFGSDAHHPDQFQKTAEEHAAWVRELALTEADRFLVF